MDRGERTRELLNGTCMVPVLTIEDAGLAVDLAGALARGGLRVLEVTLRTPASLDAVRAIRNAMPELALGVGTVLSRRQAEDAIEAGASFLVSPGATDRVLDAFEALGAPALPGCATATEAMRLLERGWRFAKFFPAEAAGGAPALRGLAEPLAQLRFCPTGGVTEANAAAYLALPNVLCVGGSWPAPRALVAARDWDGITARAEAASRLRP